MTEVGVETVAPGPVSRVLAVNGRIAGERSVDVRPQVSGKLAAVTVVEGDAGNVLVLTAEPGQLVDVKLTADTPVQAPIGLTVTANITVDQRAAAITVPRAAILRDASGAGVLVVLDGKAVRRDVRLIDWPAVRLIVTDGLSSADVVIGDATGLAAGQAVKVKP